jgi:NADH-quinone oxidoreductase subunit N
MEASAGVLFYLAVYAPVLVASFQIVSLFSNGDGHDIKAYSGLAQKSPLIAIFFAIMLLSLAGLPPMSGFIAKAITFLGAVQGGLVTLVIFAMLVSVIGVFYYLRVIVYMFMYEPKTAQTSVPSLSNAGVLGRIAFWVVAVLTFVLGVAPAFLLYLMIMAAMQLESLAAIPIH